MSKEIKKGFNIFLKADIVQKDGDGDKKFYVQGVGSTVSKDRQGERLSEKALYRLEEIATTKRIPVFSQHEHSWENTMGFIEKSIIKDGNWIVDIALENPSFNAKSALLIKKKEHGTPIGLSIGGRVISDYIDKENDSMTRVIDDLELLELSIVGIPANQDGSVVSYIAKSLEGEDEMTEEIKKEEVEAPVVEEAPVEEAPKETEEAPVVEAPKEETEAEAEAEVKEASLTRSDLEVFKKEILEGIASEISKMTAVRKSVVENTAKEINKDIESKEESLEDMLEKRFK